MLIIHLGLFILCWINSLIFTVFLTFFTFDGLLAKFKNNFAIILYIHAKDIDNSTNADCDFKIAVYAILIYS